ncbi:hypothetical protein HQ487_03010 [Candidatus Uhrbacteria bacterium]|nr:hypothetical protein [Candidatus Uhrbacteria bacterium]
MKYLFLIEIHQKGQKTAEFEVLATFRSELDALNSLSELTIVNSPLGATPERHVWRSALPEGSLARMSERYGEDAVVIVREVREYTRKMPKELRNSPNFLHLVMATTTTPPPPPQGTFTSHEDLSVH